MERYLNAIVTFTSPEDFSRTENMVNEFLNNKEAIDQINALLEQRAKDEANWVWESISLKMNKNSYMLTLYFRSMNGGFMTCI